MLVVECTYRETRNGRSYKCSLAHGHGGDHEADSAPPQSHRGVSRLGPYKGASEAVAYAHGAVDYATGNGLTRLALDLGTERIKNESDADLSKRLVALLPLRPVGR